MYSIQFYSYIYFNIIAKANNLCKAIDMGKYGNKWYIKYK